MTELEFHAVDGRTLPLPVEAASGLLTDPVLAVGSPWNYTQVEGQVDLKREAMTGLVRSLKGDLEESERAEVVGAWAGGPGAMLMFPACLYAALPDLRDRGRRHPACVLHPPCAADRLRA